MYNGYLFKIPNVGILIQIMSAKMGLYLVANLKTAIVHVLAFIQMQLVLILVARRLPPLDFATNNISAGGLFTIVIFLLLHCSSWADKEGDKELRSAMKR